MYKFTRHEFDWLIVHASSPALGDTHRKTFLLATNPSDQSTLNLYVAGQFVIEIGEFSQTMAAGASSLDLDVDEILPGVVVLERAVSDGGVRLCIQARDHSIRWTRKRVGLSEGETISAVDGFIVPMTPDVQAHRTYTAGKDESVFVLERI